jgi:hypothetical protein
MEGILLGPDLYRAPDSDGGILLGPDLYRAPTVMEGMLLFNS